MLSKKPLNPKVREIIWESLDQFGNALKRIPISCSLNRDMNQKYHKLLKKKIFLTSQVCRYFFNPSSTRLTYKGQCVFYPSKPVRPEPVLGARAIQNRGKSGMPSSGKTATKPL